MAKMLHGNETPLEAMETVADNMAELAEKMKNDDGIRVAFEYIGPKLHPSEENGTWFEMAQKGTDSKIYDDRQWAMVDPEDGNGAKLMLISRCLPSVELARKWGYKENEYKPVGKINIYTDKLGFYSEYNTHKERPLKGEHEIEHAMEEWFKLNGSDEQNIMDAFKHNTEIKAKQARQYVQDKKGWQPPKNDKL